MYVPLRSVHDVGRESTVTFPLQYIIHTCMIILTVLRIRTRAKPLFLTSTNSISHKKTKDWYSPA